MVEVLSRRSSGQSYVYALVDRVPRRWRPPAAGVGGGSVVAQSIHDLVLIVSPVTSPLARTLRSQAVHDDVVVKDRKSTRLNSSHDQISYAVSCLKKKTAEATARRTP